MLFNYDPIPREVILEMRNHPDEKCRAVANAFDFVSKRLLLERMLANWDLYFHGQDRNGMSYKIWDSIRRGDTPMDARDARELEVLALQCGGWWEIDPDTEGATFIDGDAWVAKLKALGVA